jgi:hypothetical protein
MMGSDEECGGSRKPGAEDRGWSSIGRVLGSRTIERSGYAVCGLYHARGDEERGFLGLASKPRSMVCQWFGLKTTRAGFPVWASKLAARFGDLVLKITTTVSWFGPQNQVGYSLSVAP